jgi:hypothetical protein
VSELAKSLKTGGDGGEPSEVDLLRCELRATRELLDKLPPRFGAPHGPVWVPETVAPPPSMPIQEIRQNGGKQQPGRIAAGLLVTGPNAEPPLPR